MKGSDPTQKHYSILFSAANRAISKEWPRFRGISSSGGGHGSPTHAVQQFGAIPFGLERQRGGYRGCQEGSLGSDVGSCPRCAPPDELARLHSRWLRRRGWS